MEVEQLTVDFSQSVKAFGFDYDAGANGPNSGDLTAQTSIGDDFVIPGGLNVKGFFGVVSTGPIDSFVTAELANRLRGSDNWEAFSAIPEPSGFSALGLGLLGLVGCRRKRKATR